MTSLVLSPGNGALLRLGGAGYSLSLMTSRSRQPRDRQAEVELVERAQRGDTDAQSRLVRGLLPHLRQVAQALLGRTADADDAIQVGFAAGTPDGLARDLISDLRAIPNPYEGVKASW